MKSYDKTSPTIDSLVPVDSYDYSEKINLKAIDCNEILQIFLKDVGLTDIRAVIAKCSNGILRKKVYGS